MISTPTFEYGDPGGPIRNGTTYIVRPFIDPRKSGVSFSRAASGAIQLLVGPASSLFGGADEGEMFRAGDVVRRASMEVAAGKLLLIQLDQLSGGEAFCDEAIAFGLRSVAIHDRRRHRKGFDFGHPCYELPSSLHTSYRRRFCVVKSSIMRRRCSGQLRIADAVGRPGIHHHLERLARPLQLVGKLHGVLRMHVVVERAVDQQQLARSGWLR